MKMTQSEQAWWDSLIKHKPAFINLYSGVKFVPNGIGTSSVEYIPRTFQGLWKNYLQETNVYL
jgi:hypothetical protein